MQVVRESFERAQRADFAKVFYDLLLVSDVKVRRKFQETNFERQRELLIHGIHSMIDYAEGKAIGRMAMERLAKLHDHAHLDVPAPMYDLWLAAFVSTMQKVDPKFDAALEKEWRGVLEPALALMVKAYRPAPART